MNFKINLKQKYFLIVLVTNGFILLCRRKAREAARNLDRSTSTISTANLYQPNSYQWLAEQREAEAQRIEREKTLERARILEEMIHERALEKARAIETPMPSVHFKPQPSRSNTETMDTESCEHISLQKPD